MIFASDLDQTLIFSEKFLNNNYCKNTNLEDSISIIEYFNGKPLSYIKNDLIPILQMLDKENNFVPVTTRTEKQFKRIAFSDFNIYPEYAITTNGAKVLHNGAVDKEWDETIKERLAVLEHSPNDICGLIEDSLSSNAIKSIRSAENVFSYCVLHMDKLNHQEVQNLSNKLDTNKWTISLQGRKLYCMPSVINKWEATEYVCSKIGTEKVFGAGDSLLDLPLLQNADIGLIPAHGEIFNKNLQEEYNLETSNFKGINASKEIAEIARNIIMG